MPVHHLTSVDGEIVHDVDPDVVPGARGRVYLREGVTADDGAALARAATMRAALFEERIIGAAVTVRPRLIDSDDETLARVAAEVEPMAESGTFALSPETTSPAPGVAAAMDAWFAGLDGRSVVVHGLDDLGLEVARAVDALGGRLVGVSNHSGAIADGGGLDVEAVADARADHGALFVTEMGLELHLPDELFDLSVDAIVLAGGVGSITAELAGRVGADVVVPATDAPFTDGGLEALRRRRIVALPDTATTAGPMLEATAPRGLTPAETAARSVRLIRERIDGARTSKVDPLRYATMLSDTFLTTWVPAEVR